MASYQNHNDIFVKTRASFRDNISTPVIVTQRKSGHMRLDPEQSNRIGLAGAGISLCKKLSQFEKNLRRARHVTKRHKPLTSHIGVRVEQHQQ